MNLNQSIKNTLTNFTFIHYLAITSKLWKKAKKGLFLLIIQVQFISDQVMKQEKYNNEILQGIFVQTHQSQQVWILLEMSMY